MLDGARNQDSVTGVWQVPQAGTAEVWCDVCILAVASYLRCDGEEAKYVSWLRKENDSMLIDADELEVVLKGLNKGMIRILHYLYYFFTALFIDDYKLIYKQVQ